MLDLSLQAFAKLAERLTHTVLQLGDSWSEWRVSKGNLGVTRGMLSPGMPQKMMFCSQSCDAVLLLWFLVLSYWHLPVSTQQVKLWWLVVHSGLLFTSSSPWELCTGYSTFSEILPKSYERCVKRKLIVLCWIIIKTIKILFSRHFHVFWSGH